VHDEDGVVANGRNVPDQYISTLPEGKVVAVAFVAIWCQVPLPAVRVHENDGDASLAGERRDLLAGVVVGNGLEDVVVAHHYVLDGRLGRDEVREVGRTATPSHRQRSVVATTIGATVRPIRRTSGIVAEHGGELFHAGQGEGVIGVLEKDGASRTDLTDQPRVLVTDVNMFVGQLVACLDDWVFVAISLKRPGVEVERNPGPVASDVVVSCHDTGNHIVDAPLGHCAVENSDGEVGTPIGYSGIERGISRHSHIQACQSGADTGMLCLPIAHDEALKVQLVLKQVVEQITVLASIAVVNLIVRAHDGTDASPNGIGEWPEQRQCHCSDTRSRRSHHR